MLDLRHFETRPVTSFEVPTLNQRTKSQKVTGVRGSGASRALRYMCTPSWLEWVTTLATNGSRRRHKISKTSSEGFDSPHQPAGQRAGKIQSHYLRAARRSAPASSYYKAQKSRKALRFRKVPRLTWPRWPKNTPSTLPMAPRARKWPKTYTVCSRCQQSAETAVELNM